MVTREEVKKYYDNIFHVNGPKYKVDWGEKFPSYHKRKGSFGYYNTFLDLLGVRLGKDDGKKILDVGCGKGDLLVDANRRGLKCFGVDISNKAIEAAKGKVEGTFLCQNVDDGIPFDDDYFDFMTCLGSLEHFQKPIAVLQEMARTLKKGGGLCLLVPNRNYFLLTLGYRTDTQPVTNFLTLAEYTELLKNNFNILRVLKENSHLFNLRDSSSYTKHFLKILVRPLVPFLPIRISQNFVFLCSKQ